MTDNLRMDYPVSEQLAAACLGRGLAHLPDEAWWPVVHRAEDAGVVGILNDVIEESGVAIPADARVALRAGATAIASQTRRLESCVAPVVRGLAEAGIPVLLLKGAALRPCIYHNPRLRPMSDIDFMIRPEDLDRALQVLERLGCRRGAALLRPDFVPTYYHEIELLTHHAVPARIDLHVRPFRPLRYVQSVPADAFWANAQKVRFGGAEVLVPCPEEMVIHLAVHAAVHGAGRLIWLYDIHRYARRYRAVLNWEAMVQRAAAWGLSLPLRFALKRTEEALGRFVPAEARCGLTARGPGLLDRLTLWHAPRDHRHPLGHLLVGVLTARGLAFRWRYLMAVMLPGQAHLESVYRRRHPGWRVCAHVWRGARWLGRLVPGVSPSAV